MTIVCDCGCTRLASAETGTTVSQRFVNNVTRKELDAAREFVERVGAENDRLRAEVARLRERVDGQAWDDLVAERDRARDLAVRAGAFEGDHSLAIIEKLQDEIDTLVYERDEARRGDA